MNQDPQIFGLHAKPKPLTRWILALIPFLLLIGLYTYKSHERRLENPQDKILPSISQMGQAVERLALKPDVRSGKYIFWQDTWASLKRLGIGVILAAVIGLFLGLNMGIFAGMRAFLLPVTTFISIIPPLAILPILFISFGVEEFAKIMLIFIGVFPMIARDVFLSVDKLPKEQITKSLTLGAKPLQVVYKITLPQIFPKLLDTVRLSLGPAWLFLIAAEAIASSDGLGYRIFLVRRYLAMDVIIPYALWITLLGFSMDTLLKFWIQKRHRWYVATQ